MRFDILAKLDYKRCHFESCPTNWRLACHASFSTSLDDMFWNKIQAALSATEMKFILLSFNLFIT